MCRFPPQLQISNIGLKHKKQTFDQATAGKQQHVSVGRGSARSPRVSGLIHEVAQWIFRGQPLNTLEKHAPICKQRSGQINDFFKSNDSDLLQTPAVLRTLHNTGHNNSTTPFSMKEGNNFN